MIDNLWYSDIATLAAHYRSGRVSPVEVTQALLDRIARLDGRLNAFTTVLRDDALAQARAAETALRRGEDRGPLHGIPVSLKDLIDTAGVRTTATSRRWHNRVPAHSATVAERLADAGAVLLGKCNLLEFAYGIVHPDFGQCNNPWNTARTSGGSSSGSASAVAAGLSYGSVGTDTGGSIRIPASYCGVIGLKPTYGRVSVHGVCPLSPSLDHVGPLTRTVADAATMLQAMAGYDPRDSTSLCDSVPDYAAALTGDVRGLRLGVIVGHENDLRPGVAEATDAALRTLERAGATLQTVTIPQLDNAEQALLDIILPEASRVHQDDLRDHAADYAPLTRAQLEQGLRVSAVAYLRAQEIARQLRAALLDTLRDVDVLVCPSVAWEAPAEDPPVEGQEGLIEGRRTGPFNVTGLPAISVPCGFGLQGLPLGIQFVAAPLAEPLLLRVAHAYEQCAGWSHQHPKIE